MPNVVKENSIGVDKKIAGLQKYLYGKLLQTWGLEQDEFTMYGRCYSNQDETGIKPEVYIGSGEYKEVYFDDNLKALCFFLVGDRADFALPEFTVPVSLIFMVNVEQVKPGASRNDEECRVDVIRLLKTPPYNFSITGWAKGIPETFREFSGWSKEDGIKYRDMQPLHCFRVNMNLMYNPLDC